MLAFDPFFTFSGRIIYRLLIKFFGYKPAVLDLLSGLFWFGVRIYRSTCRCIKAFNIFLTPMMNGGFNLVSWQQFLLNINAQQMTSEFQFYIKNEKNYKVHM